MSNFGFPVTKVCLVSALLLSVPLGRAIADEPANSPNATKRVIIRDQRPDDSRGWFVVSKESYWPLCYESLDRIEEARKLIGNADHERTAEAFEKCGAWLRLAASAAMTDGQSGVAITADAFQDAANVLRDGSSAWSPAELSDLTTLGFVVMAKSHVLRAAEADQSYKATRASRKTENPSTELKAAAREIAAENTAKQVAQYRYDLIESQRHLTVAQTYLEAAAKAGNFSIDDKLTAPIPELTSEKSNEMVDYVNIELRPRVESMNGFIAERQKELRKKLGEKL